METKYYVDINGNYIGGYCGAEALALVPKGAIEVPSAPNNALDTWNGTEWIVYII